MEAPAARNGASTVAPPPAQWYILSCVRGRPTMDDSLDSSLQYKLGAIVLSVTVIALGIFGSLLLEHVERTEYQEASEHLLDSGRRVRGMLAVNHQLMQVATDKHFAAFEAMLDGPIRA